MSVSKTDGSPTRTYWQQMAGSYTLIQATLALLLVAMFVHVYSTRPTALLNPHREEKAGVGGSSQYRFSGAVAESPYAAVASGSDGESKDLVSPTSSFGLDKPVLLVEVGAMILTQAIGLPLLSRLGMVARRLRWMGVAVSKASPRLVIAGAHQGRRLGATLLTRQLRFVSQLSSRFWKLLGNIYAKTSASKIVNRSKKLIKVFWMRGEDEEEESAKA